MKIPKIVGYMAFVIAFIMVIAVIWSGIYEDNMLKKYNPRAYAQKHAQHDGLFSDENYTFCDMGIVQAIPLFISPSGCHK